MKRRRHIREKDERRRRNADLRRVQNPDVRAIGTHRRVRRGHLGDESVQRRRRHARAPRRGDLVDRLEHFARAFARQRRDVEDRRVIQEPHPMPQRVVEGGDKL